MVQIPLSFMDFGGGGLPGLKLERSFDRSFQLVDEVKKKT